MFFNTLKKQFLSIASDPSASQRTLQTNIVEKLSWSGATLPLNLQSWDRPENIGARRDESCNDRYRERLWFVGWINRSGQDFGTVLEYRPVWYSTTRRRVRIWHIVEVKTKRQIRDSLKRNFLSQKIFRPQRYLFGCLGTFPTQFGLFEYYSPLCTLIGHIIDFTAHYYTQHSTERVASSSNIVYCLWWVCWGYQFFCNSSLVSFITT